MPFRAVHIGLRTWIFWLSLWASAPASAHCAGADEDSFRHWAHMMGNAATSRPDLRKEVEDKIQLIRNALSKAVVPPDREKCLRAFDEGVVAGRREKDTDSCGSVVAQRGSVEKEVARLDKEAARLAAESKSNKKVETTGMRLEPSGAYIHGGLLRV